MSKPTKAQLAVLKRMAAGEVLHHVIHSRLRDGDSYFFIPGERVNISIIKGLRDRNLIEPCMIRFSGCEFRLTPAGRAAAQGE